MGTIPMKMEIAASVKIQLEGVKSVRILCSLVFEHPSKPEKAHADLSTEMSFKPIFAIDAQDELNQRIYDGVHNGLAIQGGERPKNGLVVQITRLQLMPRLQNLAKSTTSFRQLGDAVEALIAGMVHICDVTVRGRNVRT